MQSFFRERRLLKFAQSSGEHMRIEDQEEGDEVGAHWARVRASLGMERAPVSKNAAVGTDVTSQFEECNIPLTYPHSLQNECAEALRRILSVSAFQDNPPKRLPLVIPANKDIMMHAPEVYGEPVATVIKAVQPSCLVLLGGMEVYMKKEAEIMRQQIRVIADQLGVTMYSEATSQSTIENAHHFSELMVNKNIDITCGYIVTQLRGLLQRALYTFENVLKKDYPNVPRPFGYDIPLPEGLMDGEICNKYASVYLPVLINEVRLLGSMQYHISNEIMQTADTVFAHIRNIQTETSSMVSEQLSLPFEQTYSLSEWNNDGLQVYTCPMSAEVRVERHHEKVNAFANRIPLSQMAFARDTGLYDVAPIELSYKDHDPCYKQLFYDIQGVLYGFEREGYGDQNASRVFLGGSSVIGAILSLPIDVFKEFNPLTNRKNARDWWEVLGAVSHPNSPFDGADINSEMSDSLARMSFRDTSHLECERPRSVRVL